MDDNTLRKWIREAKSKGFDIVELFFIFLDPKEGIFNNYRYQEELEEQYQDDSGTPKKRYLRLALLILAMKLCGESPQEIATTSDYSEKHNTAFFSRVMSRAIRLYYFQRVGEDIGIVTTRRLVNFFKHEQINLYDPTSVDETKLNPIIKMILQADYLNNLQTKKIIQDIKEFRNNSSYERKINRLLELST